MIQEDLQKSTKGGNSKSGKLRDNQVSGNGQMDPIIIEELHKRIMENAQLASEVCHKQTIKIISGFINSSHNRFQIRIMKLRC